MEPLHGIYVATRVKTSSSMLLDALRRATGSNELPMTVGKSSLQFFSVGSKQDSLSKKAEMPTFFRPTCLFNTT